MEVKSRPRFRQRFLAKGRKNESPLPKKCRARVFSARGRECKAHHRPVSPAGSGWTSNSSGQTKTSGGNRGMMGCLLSPQMILAERLLKLYSIIRLTGNQWNPGCLKLLRDAKAILPFRF